MVGVNEFQDTLNPAMKHIWESIHPAGEPHHIKDVLQFAVRYLRHRKANDGTRMRLQSLLYNIIGSYLTPGFERYVIDVYSRDHDLNALPRVLRGPSNRLIGSLDPGLFCKA